MDTSNIKVGDTVYIRSRYGWNGAQSWSAVVDKITPSGLIKVGGRLFRKDGSERKDGGFNRGGDLISHAEHLEICAENAERSKKLEVRAVADKLTRAHNMGWPEIRTLIAQLSEIAGKGE